MAAALRRLIDFEQHHRNLARPFEWTFTRTKLARVLDKINDREHTPLAAAA